MGVGFSHGVRKLSMYGKVEGKMARGKYAKNTSVSSHRTKEEIELVLRKYGADAFTYGWDNRTAWVGFKIQGRAIKITFTLPDKESKEFTHTPSRGIERTDEEACRLWEQACRESWRSLLLFVKATLEAIEMGIITLDQAFLPYILREDGRTIFEWLSPQMPKMLTTGEYHGT